ncbi:MAG: helix-turn-helix domain-containing protein [Saprospiraceae bacterium]
MNIANANIFDLIILLGGIQGIIFSIFLFFNPRSSYRSNLFLAIFIFSFSINSIYYTFEALGIRTGAIYSVYEYLPLNCSLLIITCFHFFVLFLIEPERRFSKKDGLLFLPAFFQFCFQIYCMYWCLADRDFMIAHIRWLINVFSFIDLFAVIFSLVILILAIRRINTYEKALLQNYAEVEKISLKWLKQLIILLFIIWGIWMIPTIYEQVSGNPSIEIYYPMWILMSGLIYWIGYSTYSKKDLLKVKMYHKNEAEEKPIVKNLSEKTDVYYQNLIRLMETEKPYLNPDLNLKLLSDTLKISSGYLSQIINKNEEKNFFEFINGYRVNAVIKKFNDPQLVHLSILGIAFEAGFKSKSTFNAAFKKITGVTPSVFKKANQ